MKRYVLTVLEDGRLTSRTFVDQTAAVKAWADASGPRDWMDWIDPFKEHGFLQWYGYVDDFVEKMALLTTVEVY